MASVHVTNLNITVLVEEDRTLQLTWKFGKEHLDHYIVTWQYQTANSTWLDGQKDEITRKVSTYSPPKTAQYVRVRVKPVSKTYTQKDTSTKKSKTLHYWTGEVSAWKTYYYYINPFIAPNAPEVVVNPATSKITARLSELNLTTLFGAATLKELGSKASERCVIRFQFIRDDTTVTLTRDSTIKLGEASCSIIGLVGHHYKVRVRAAVLQPVYNTVTTSTSTNKTGLNAGITNRKKVIGLKFSSALASPWSDSYSNTVYTRPAKPEEIKTLKRNEDGNVYISWSEVSAVAGYRIEFAKDSKFTDSVGYKEIKRSDDPVTHKLPTNTTIDNIQDPGIWYFRVSAFGHYNSATSEIFDTGYSKPTEAKSIGLGIEPAPPTTWSSVSSGIIGDDVTLYWVHNSVDGSEEVEAYIQYKYDDSSNWQSITVPKDSEDHNPISSYVLAAPTGTFKWRVRTRGDYPISSDFSIVREVKLYSEPGVSLSIDGMDSDNYIHAFPISVTFAPDAVGQQPVSADIYVKTLNNYITTNEYGDDKFVEADTTVYSKHILWHSEDDESFYINANDISLQNGEEYYLTATVFFDSGLTAAASLDFTTDFDESDMYISATVVVDTDKVTATIIPKCDFLVETDNRYRVVAPTYNPQTGEVLEYRMLDKITQLPEQYEEVEGGQTTNGFDVYVSISASPMYFCEYDGLKTVYYEVEYDSENDLYYPTFDELSDQNPAGWETDDMTSGGEYIVHKLIGEEIYYWADTRIDPEDANIILSVYRKELGGDFTEIETGLNSDGTDRALDPHPPLNNAEYRIVATNLTTGSVDYYDTGEIFIGETGIVIQWGTSFVPADDLNPEQVAHDDIDLDNYSSLQGEFLRLPYNIDVSDSYAPDVELVNYIGRKDPVSYYGTQHGHTSTWSASIPAEDTQTLKQLRKLAVYMGDAYVREPYGTGYWAHVGVSFSQTYNEVVVPITLNITKVEGGM